MLEGLKKDNHVKVGLDGRACKKGKMVPGEERNKHVKAGLDVKASNLPRSGKMAPGEERDKHVNAGLDGGASKSGKMATGEEKDNHVKTAFDGKTAARLKLLQQLDEAKGGGWCIVAERQHQKCGCKMIHVKKAQARAGSTLRSAYSWSWCFTDGVDTYSNKRCCRNRPL